MTSGTLLGICVCSMPQKRARWREVVQIIFGLDTQREPERARIVHDSHLARARWMTETGYRYLLRPPVK
jgi:hypothetical protein